MRVLLTRPQRTLLNYRVPDLGPGYLATGLRAAEHVPVLHVPDAQGWSSQRARKGTTLQQAAQELGYVSREDFGRIVRPEAMVRPAP